MGADPPAGEPRAHQMYACLCTWDDARGEVCLHVSGNYLAKRMSGRERRQSDVTVTSEGDRLHTE